MKYEAKIENIKYKQTLELLPNPKQQDFKLLFELLCDENNIKYEYASNGRGRAYIDIKNIKIPTALGYKGLMIAIHEIVHICIGNINPIWKGEIIVDKIAEEIFGLFNIRLPMRVRNFNKRCRAYNICKALNRKAKIPANILNQYKDFIIKRKCYGINIKQQYKYYVK